MKKTISLTLVLCTLLSVGAFAAPLIELKDIAGHWAEQDIQTLADRGIISGKGDGYFKPQDTLTVAEFLKMCLGAIRQDVGKSSTGYWASPYIAKALELGMISKGQFTSYDRPILREEMAAIGINAYGRINALGSSLVTGEIRGSISDYRAISDKYKDSVLNSYLVGLLTGKGNGFAPKGTATRAEASTVVIRMIDETKRKPFDLSSIPHWDTTYAVWNPEKEEQLFDPNDPATWELDGYVMEPVTMYAPINSKGQRVTEIIDLLKFGEEYAKKTPYACGAGYSPVQEGAGISTGKSLKEAYKKMTANQIAEDSEFVFHVELYEMADATQFPYHISFHGVNDPTFMKTFKAKHGELWDAVMLALFGADAKTMDSKITQLVSTYAATGAAVYEFTGVLNGRKYSGAIGGSDFGIYITDCIFKGE